MKIFVVSHSAVPTNRAELPLLLGQIEITVCRATPVVLIDQFHNLDARSALDLESKSGQHLEARFRLEEFREKSQLSSMDSVAIDLNLFAEHLHHVQAPWVSFDVECHQAASVAEFLRKLARYYFLSNRLTEQNVVILVPPAYLSFFGRLANEAFNNLPVGSLEIARNGQTKMLLMSTTIERVIIGLPFLTRPLLRMRSLLLQMYRRMIRMA